ncbi:probable E3 ubiquitin-protein ligase makorin-1 [Saccostrea cucullata]|uniref:probable E3 ubiquitin-protein ligase makorin-1 n=1 Tax=Saccostrea cuccullata TaxID=36930 RepID=UPI002ED10D7A
MAEGGVDTPPWASRIQCRYFLHGVCRQGSDCHYAHDKAAKPSNVCRYYLAGRCSYGAGCRYDHSKPKPPAVKPTPVQRIMNPVQNTELSQLKMTSLKKGGQSDVPSLPTTPKPPEQWVKATEFVPGKPYICSSIPASYAKATKDEESDLSLCFGEEPVSSGQLLCPYLAKGVCPYDSECEYIHGDMCEMCGLAVLHPTDKIQRQEHIKLCEAELEENMEHSFAIARSKDKACGICMDIVMEKQPPTEQRFGIMSDCNHIFCLSCIRKWRGAKQFERKIVRACPECRVSSNFVTPSKYWVESDEEKNKLIAGYKEALSNKSCKYFKQGSGDCPFNDKCFYLHALPDGTIAEPKPRVRRRRQNAEGDVDVMGRINLWDFLEEYDNRLDQLFLLELEAELDNVLLDLWFVGDESTDDEEF